MALFVYDAKLPHDPIVFGNGQSTRTMRELFLRRLAFLFVLVGAWNRKNWLERVWSGEGKRSWTSGWVECRKLKKAILIIHCSVFFNENIIYNACTLKNLLFFKIDRTFSLCQKCELANPLNVPNSLIHPKSNF